MKKEHLFAVLCELDDDIVSAAQASGRRRPSWKLWGVTAACLALVCAAALFLLPRGEEVTVSPGVADAAPMVYVNGILYKQSLTQESFPEPKAEFVYLGAVKSVTTQSPVPGEELQANHPIVGCEVYRCGESIAVHINDAYWLYHPCQTAESDPDPLTEPETEFLDPTYNG